MPLSLGKILVRLRVLLQDWYLQLETLCGVEGNTQMHPFREVQYNQDRSVFRDVQHDEDEHQLQRDQVYQQEHEGNRKHFLDSNQNSGDVRNVSFERWYDVTCRVLQA